MTLPALSLSRFGTPEQLEVLRAIEPCVQGAMQDHQARRKLWFPNDHLPADAGDGAERDAQLAELRRAARELPDAVRVALTLNLLTEEGLPHFHRLIAVHFGADSPWRDWNNLWTAEEDRHGCVMRDYVRDSRVFNMGAVERLQYQYIEAGFDPDWEQDPYRLLAYTSLQEKATQVSHANTGRLASGIEPVLQSVLAHVAADESRHYLFYRAAFEAILKLDPNRALASLQKVTLNFAMPGHNIDGFSDMSEVLRRAGIFGTRQYLKIVEDLLGHWKIGLMTGLDSLGRQMQDKLMKVPARLARMADYLDGRSAPRTFAFPLLDGRSLTL